MKYRKIMFNCSLLRESYPKFCTVTSTKDSHQIPKNRIAVAETLRSSRLQMFFKIGVLKNFAIFTEKHLCWSLFLIKLFIYLFIYYTLKLYLPLVHKIAFANKFQLYHKIKYNIYYISLHIKHPQSISPMFLILFLNSNNELLDFTTAGRLFHIREPRK